MVNRELRGFGISFSKGLDLDGNGLTDFAVGAHKSGTAVVLRSVPSVWAEIKSTSSLPSIDISNIKDFLVTVCVTLRSHYSSDLLPRDPVLDEAIVTIKADPRCDFVQD